MGYSTDLFGTLKTDKQMNPEQIQQLKEFSDTRHGGNMDHYPDVPGFWCQWVPTEDGMGLEWDGNEKFYNYVEWLEHLIKKFFIPWGITLNGDIEWIGEDPDDRGIIRVRDNNVKAYEATISYPEED